MPKLSFGSNKEVSDYLVKNKPGVSLYLTGVLFITNIITLITTHLDAYILLYPQDITNVLLWYKLVTYPLFVGGFFAWFQSALVIVSAGYFIEPKFERKKVLLLIALSSVIGGLAYAMANLDDPFNQPIASPTMITWGLSACAVTLILKRIKTAPLMEKIIAGLFLLSFFNLNPSDTGYFLGQVSVIVVGLLFGLFLEEKLTRVSDISFLNKPRIK
ncbi:MAG: putative Membrane protein [Segetibacter sp.]|nr:putative Membrane protein [Segetibacter sp.]